MRGLSESTRGATWRRPSEPPRVSQAPAAAIERACEVRGDDPAHRDGLIAECMALPFEAQADLLAHFTAEAAR